MVEPTHLKKKYSQIGSSPQVGVKIKKYVKPPRSYRCYSWFIKNDLKEYWYTEPANLNEGLLYQRFAEILCKYTDPRHPVDLGILILLHQHSYTKNLKSAGMTRCLGNHHLGILLRENNHSIMSFINLTHTIHVYKISIYLHWSLKNNHSCNHLGKYTIHGWYGSLCHLENLLFNPSNMKTRFHPLSCFSPPEW